MSGWGDLSGAYILFFILLFGYSLCLCRRSRKGS